MVKLKEIGKVEITEVATPEEAAAIKNILEKAGLIIKCKGREIWIWSQKR